MIRRLVRSPYFWSMVLVAGAVSVAWVGRERYREAAVVSGSNAPPFTFPDLEGNPVSLTDFRDHVVLVNIWATWCGPCRDEMPSMQRLYELLEGEPFEILAVSVDAPPGVMGAFGFEGGDLQEFVDEFGLTFPILHDPSGDIADTYQITGVPESFVIAKGGRIYRKVAGATEWDLPGNADLIRRLLAD